MMSTVVLGVGDAPRESGEEGSTPRVSSSATPSSANNRSLVGVSRSTRARLAVRPKRYVKRDRDPLSSPKSTAASAARPGTSTTVSIGWWGTPEPNDRSEEHTSELQSL